MTPIADMVERMLAANAPAASIVDAIRTIENLSGTLSRTAIKNHERDRKREWRETRKPQALSTPTQANDGAGSVAENVPSNVPDNAAERCDLSATSSFLLPEVVTKEGSKKAKKERSENARARGTRIERDAVLSDTDRAAAIELGASPDAVDGTWAEFIDYWIGVPGQRGTKLDWPATWRNRVRMIATKGNGNGQGPHHNRASQTPRSGATGQDAILAGMGRLADRIRKRSDAERRERGLSDDADAAPGDDARLL